MNIQSLLLLKSRSLSWCWNPFSSVCKRRCTKAWQLFLLCNPSNVLEMSVDTTALTGLRGLACMHVVVRKACLNYITYFLLICSVIPLPWSHDLWSHRHQWITSVVTLLPSVWVLPCSWLWQVQITVIQHIIWTIRLFLSTVHTRVKTHRGAGLCFI